MFRRASAPNSSLSSKSPQRRTDSLNRPAEELSEEQNSKRNEVITAIEKLGPTLVSAANLIVAYEKNKNALSEVNISNVSLNAPTNSNLVKLEKKQELEKAKTNNEEEISSLFKTYNLIVKEAKAKIAEARTLYPKMEDLNTRLNFYIGPYTTYTNTITKLEAVYKTIKQDDSKDLHTNPWLNDTITDILEFNEDTYKDKINKMIENSKDYTPADKIKVYGTLVYYLIVRIKSKNDEELPKKLPKKLPENDDFFVTEEIFMRRKKHLEEIFSHLQNSPSDMDIYPSLQKVFDLLTLAEEDYSNSSHPSENFFNEFSQQAVSENELSKKLKHSPKYPRPNRSFEVEDN